MTCSHKWMMLSTIEYEVMTWNDTISPWNVRGCLKCQHVEFQYDSKERVGWSELTLWRITSEEELSTYQIRNYIKRMELFKGEELSRERH